MIVDIRVIIADGRINIHRFHDKWKGIKIIVLRYVTPCTLVNFISTAKEQVWIIDVAWTLYFWVFRLEFRQEKS
jgi:hypothetical protein